MAPILLLDVYSLFFRAYHALPQLTTQAGLPTSALYGMSSLIIKLWREERPKGATFAIDPPGPTFRHTSYAEYKATRPRVLPGSLPEQLARLPSLLDAFGFPRISADGFEADDVLATLATRLAADGEAPMVVTGDHDALQLAEAPVTVLIVGRKSVKDQKYDEATVREKLGVGPRQVPDWKALVGDPSDNLPGVHGIGGKTAQDLIARHGGVEGIAREVASLTPKARALIEPRLQDILQWRDLATLRRDVPLPAPPWSLPLDAAARERLRALFTALEFRSLLPRLDALEL